MNEITLAIKKAKSLNKLANVCNVTYQAVRKWEKAGKLPRTEWTGETSYSEKIYKEFGVAIPPYIPSQEKQKSA